MVLYESSCLAPVGEGESLAAALFVAMTSYYCHTMSNYLRTDSIIKPSITHG